LSAQQEVWPSSKEFAQQQSKVSVSDIRVCRLVGVDSMDDDEIAGLIDYKELPVAPPRGEDWSRKPLPEMRPIDSNPPKIAITDA